MNSREKGKRGERELAGELRRHGYDARRGQQYCGVNGDADVVGLPGLHIECKRVERLDLYAAMAQAEKEGRLVVLPCDVGDKLYDVTLGEVREKIVISLSMLLSKSVNHLVIHAENFRNAVTSYELQDIGKTFFLTREAAEAALKEREAEYDTGRTTIGNSRLLG